MSNSTGLSNNMQAVLVFLAAVIAALAGWATAGFPTDKIAIGAVVAAILLGAGLAIKELLGSQTTTTTSTTSPTATTATPKAAATPTAVYRIKRRLMFLQLRN